MFITDEELKKEYTPDHPFDGICRPTTLDEQEFYKKNIAGVYSAPKFIARKWDDDECEWFETYGGGCRYIGDTDIDPDHFMFITDEDITANYRPDHPFNGIARQLTTDERKAYKEETGVDLSPCYVARRWDDDDDSFFNNYGSSRLYIGDQGY